MKYKTYVHILHAVLYFYSKQLFHNIAVMKITNMHYQGNLDIQIV